MTAVLAAIGIALVNAAPGKEPAAGPLSIADAWTRPAADGMSMGVAYFKISNGTDQPDVLVSATTSVAARVEMHETTITEGMARMRPLTGIGIPAHSTVAVAPGGIHLMLVDLKAPLAAGTKIPMTLRFRDAGPIEIQLSVENRTE